ncbi:Uncharacterized protein dnm_080780 [Desulfonema magnum]|uniref:Uncharacterized protein n=1 Tax=Desulfonema magnum TaxID=45655 RepID=A0A975BVQ6_9BACT|nr:Uncharacterized protein dnm_080780 [Desulfonema magnum]
MGVIFRVFNLCVKAYHLNESQQMENSHTTSFLFLVPTLCVGTRSLKLFSIC